MKNYAGSPNAIAVQKRLHRERIEISRTPELCNGGRILHFVEPEKYGWDRVVSHAETDGMIGFPLVDEDQIRQEILAHLGNEWKTPSWLALTGSEDQVLRSSRKIAENQPLPEGWKIRHDLKPEDHIVSSVQDLNHQTGVSPYPAFYMKSQATQVLTTTIWQANGDLVATASVADRYHPKSRLGGYMFAGMVSVHEDQRKLGLGKLVNALAMIESHQRFGWTIATEQVSADNPASIAMIKSCGLDRSAGLVSVAAMNTGETFSR